MKKSLIILLVLFFSLQSFGQTSKSKFMKIKLVSSYPNYTFEDESSSALILVDGKVTEFKDLSKISRQQFCKLTFNDTLTTNYVLKYGNIAKNGVFEISTKNYLAKKWLSDLVSIDDTYKLKQMVSSKNFDHTRLMIILNGRELTTDFFNEPKIDVKSISSLHLASFKGIFGGMLTIQSYENDISMNNITD